MASKSEVHSEEKRKRREEQCDKKQSSAKITRSRSASRYVRTRRIVSFCYCHVFVESLPCSCYLPTIRLSLTISHSLSLSLSPSLLLAVSLSISLSLYIGLSLYVHLSFIFVPLSSLPSFCNHLSLVFLFALPGYNSFSYRSILRSPLAFASHHAFNKSATTRATVVLPVPGLPSKKALRV